MAENGNGTSVSYIAVRLTGIMLLAWAGWLTTAILRGEQDRAAMLARMESTNRRIDGVATVLQGFCKPIPDPIKETP